MTTEIARFKTAIERIDAANSADPESVVRDGVARPRELVYSERMSRWLERLAPDASEALRLAVRAQHIRRWTIPRANYPEGKRGYHHWRTTLYKFHAEQAGAILRDIGYEDVTVGRVQSLLCKEDLKRDPECQTLEDVACLVFLEDYFEDFSQKHDEEKLITILRKTWRKMSARAQ